MADFLARHEHASRRMKKAWITRQAKRAATTYNLSLTVTQRDAAPGTDVAIKLEMADIGREAAEQALQQIRQAAIEGCVSLPRYTADIIGLSSGKGIAREREGTLPKMLDRT